jgi:DNA-binding CsgD family transcriptional regulator
MTEYGNKLPSKDELQKLLEKHTKKEIANMLGISIYDLNAILRRYKLIPTKTPNFAEKLADYLALYSHDKVAQLLRVNIRTVYYYIEKYNLTEDKNYKVKGIKDKTTRQHWYYIIKEDKINRINQKRIKPLEL